MTQAEKYDISMRIILICVTVIYFAQIYSLYKKTKKSLFAHQNAIIVSPARRKFLLSWFVFFLTIFIPLMILLWVIRLPKEVLLVCVFFLPVQHLLLSIPAYFYYSISIYDNKIEGGSLWATRWRRTEINFNELYRGEIAHEKFLNMLGVNAFFSNDDEQVISFGLDNVQVLQVLDVVTNIKAQT